MKEFSTPQLSAQVLDANVAAVARAVDSVSGAAVWTSSRACASDTSPTVDAATGRVFFSCDASGDLPAGLLAYDAIARYGARSDCN